VMGDASDEIQQTARAITELFLASGEDVQLAIEQGFLEHALESSGLRPFFQHWSTDKRLHDAWQAATDWANDHPDWSWNLHQEFLGKMRE
jgi:hypothetical protein